MIFIIPTSQLGEMRSNTRILLVQTVKDLVMLDASPSEANAWSIGTENHVPT